MRAKAQITAAMAKSQVSGLTITTQKTDSNSTVTATGTTPTTLTRIAGFKSLPVKVTGTTPRGSGNLEPMLKGITLSKTVAWPTR